MLWFVALSFYIILFVPDSIRRNILTRTATDAMTDGIAADWLRFASDRSGGRAARYARSLWMAIPPSCDEGIQAHARQLSSSNDPEPLPHYTNLEQTSSRCNLGRSGGCDGGRQGRHVEESENGPVGRNEA